MEKAKEYYVLGSNFGPYNNKEYYNYYKNVFEKANDVCFSDKNSYEKFKDLKNVRWAPDIVFTLDTSNISIKNNKKVYLLLIVQERIIANIKTVMRKKLLKFQNILLEKDMKL